MKFVKTRGARKKPTKKPARKLKVGDIVPLHWGNQKVRVIIVEDRGGLGVGGRQIVRLRFLTGDPGREFELPAEMIV